MEGFNIFEAIASCADLLTHFGGHPLAAGLGIEENKIDLFRQRMNSYAMDIHPVMPAQSIKLDCKLSPFYLNTDLVDNLAYLEPYGADNSQPIFGLFNVRLMSVTPIGDGKHIRIEVQKKGQSFKIVKFRTTADEFPYKTDDNIDLAIKVSKNFFKGRYYLSIRCEDVRLNGIDDDRYFTEKSEYELFRLGQEVQGSIYPDRACLAAIYRFLKQHNGWLYSFDDLYFALGQGISYAQLSFALDTFNEAGLISLDGEKVILNQVEGKADLENTNVIKTLKGRLNIE